VTPKSDELGAPGGEPMVELARQRVAQFRCGLATFG
jgi:hypothetical protein